MLPPFRNTAFDSNGKQAPTGKSVVPSPSPAWYLRTWYNGESFTSDVPEITRLTVNLKHHNYNYTCYHIICELSSHFDTSSHEDTCMSLTNSENVHP